MTIDDELLLEIIKPNRLGEVGEDAPIIKVVGTKRIKYTLEEPTHYWNNLPPDPSTGIYHPEQAELVRIRPDITLILPREGDREIATELENDIQWDFQDSLKQLKKYKAEFRDTRIIIPKEFSRFAPFYKNEGFRVYLWEAKRVWQCLKCGAETAKEGPVIPVCPNSKTHGSKNDFRLVGLRDTTLKEFV